MEKCRLFKERKSIPLIGHATRVVLYCNSMISLKLHWAITTLTKSFNTKTGPTSSFTALEMAISFLWALYLKASLILLATLHKSDGSLAANGANVCSRSQRYSIKTTHQFCFLSRWWLTWVDCKWNKPPSLLSPPPLKRVWNRGFTVPVEFSGR